ncbi:hypothetical protein ISF_02621 [Cordyceps fumosorosea ARSEF 2679]|uniref:Uncharacterized protein n=1 Tax=Cordyceps fumosorosea (strain ARSEF 2679) TaxID=1081104 RepID=A0A168BWT5_CORFA|nr:hypothetical protein ISF_02621 [Cordyceps fumosorosea ARSEF 2679]OAA70647.1 hypothetical protein ISF_02621 [Cordyceps fumosorosea ARSEF 2679]
MPPRRWIAVAASLASLAAASWPDPPLTGRDFDFTADFHSSSSSSSASPSSSSKKPTATPVTLSTLKPPADIVPANPVFYTPAVVTLVKLDDAARAARYIAFFEVSYIPAADTLDDVVYTYPWIRTNLSVQDAAGTLGGTADTDSQLAVAPAIDTGEVRNATLQVWRQDDDLLRYIAAIERTRVPAPLSYAISQVFSNTTTNVSYDFRRASIDFKVQNKTGTRRCDVNAEGAPVPGVPRGASACTATATAAATSSGKAGAAGSSATVSPSATSKKNAAAGGAASSGVYGWLAMAAVGALIL